MFLSYIPSYRFNRYNNKKQLICRNRTCRNLPKGRSQFFCSKRCSKLFDHWYYKRIKYYNSGKILARDKMTCNICKIKHKSNFDTKTNKYVLEVHHIKPVAEIKDQFEKKWNRLPKVKRTARRRLNMEIRYIKAIQNPDNLITLCHDCHKKITKEFNAKRRTLKPLRF